ncbi:MAG: ABC transporter permease [Planctomycetota bacterium]|nr:ABC transporter permease [Planctomycetota bacterium]
MSLTRLFQIIPLAMKSLLLHKLRSGLTILGIVFGVFSVIAMLAIGEGASIQAQKQVLDLGATNIIVRSVKPPRETSSSVGGNSSVLRYGVKHKDYDQIVGNISNAATVIPIRETSKEARYLHRSLNSRIVGTTADYLSANNLGLAQGRFLGDADNRGGDNVAVLAAETAETLFPFEDPLEKKVRIGNIFFDIIGVTKRRTASAAIGGSLSGQDFNKDIYIPLKAFQRRLVLNDLDIQRGSGSFSAEYVELNQVTVKLTNADEVIRTAEAIRETLALNHGDVKDTDVVVPLELLKQADQLRKIFNVVLGSIALISLVVGGIGIMNIMLATVTERTREIGIRRALGAQRRDITVQFLAETIVLSGSGGLVGVGLGLATPILFGWVRNFVNAYVLDHSADASELGRIFSEMQPQVAIWSLPVAFCFSVTIGIGFGLYPARAAARLDPIEALRHE